MMALHKLLATTAAIILVVVSNTALAFTTPRVCRSMHHHHHKVNRHTFVGVPALLESPSNQNEPGSKKSTARIGGRRAKKQKVTKEAKIKNNGPFAIIRQLAIPIVLVTLFLRLLFGNLFGGSNVVYYSSTVYQSTTYSRDGNIETKTKESFQSNIPGLVEREKEERSQGNNAMRGSYYDINSIEDELLDVEDEINSLYGKW
mmetsp:Transcript_27877/g.43065  ORF Transcript_27877/g.43065 Transcript_27877/m.43065 type:complete len:202 (-) Transcript_27877:2735-3340(-)